MTLLRWLNVPKCALVLSATAATLVGAAVGLLHLAIWTSDRPDPDFNFDRGRFVAFVVVPFVFLAWIVGLLLRNRDRLREAGGSWRRALAAIVWLANLVGLGLLGLYLADDAAFGSASYRGRSVGEPALLASSALAFAAMFGCAWAIAHSVRMSLAVTVFTFVAAGLYMSEASSSWLHLAATR
jgi:hypothetical protein